MSEADTAPSMGAEFLAEAEAEAAGQSELPLGNDDVVSDIAQAVPRKDSNKRVAPPPQMPPRPGQLKQSKGGLEQRQQQPPAEKPFDPIEVEVNGKKIRAESREELEAQLRRGYALMQKARQLEQERQAMAEDRALLQKNPRAWFLRQNAENTQQARAAAEALLLDEAIYNQLLEKDAVDGGQRAKAFALEKRQEYEQEANALRQQREQQQRQEMEVAKEAETLETQFVEAIEKHGYPRSPIAIKIMANVLADCEQEDHHPSTPELVRESYKMLAELQGQHFEAMGPKNILQGISKRHLEWIRQALVAQARGPQRQPMQSRNATVKTNANGQRRPPPDPYGNTKEDFDNEIKKLMQSYTGAKTYGG